MPEAIAPARPRHGLMRTERPVFSAIILLRPALPSRHRTGRAAEGRARQLQRPLPDLAVTSEPVSTADRLLHTPLLIVEILSPSDWRRTWANVALYTTISSVREILVLHTAKDRAVLLRREADGTWPNNPRRWRWASVRLDSISFIAPVAAFYRTAGVA